MMILCLLACMAWIVGLTWMVLCPIERDRQLSHGKAKNLLLVICAIITLPLVLTFIISKMEVEPEELVFDEGMYQKWQPYAFQKEVDSISYSVAKGDTSIIYSPKSYRERQMDNGKYDDPSLVWTVYYQFINPNRQNMAATSRGRTIAFCLSVLGMILMTGLLVSLISNFFQRRIERWRNGQIRYTHGLGRFCVVVGTGEMLASTLKQLDQRYSGRLQHIIVLTNKNIPELRRNLVSELPKSLEKKIVLYYGESNEQAEIRQLRCKECDEVFILGDDRAEKSVHDTKNIRCMNLISDSLPIGKERLKIHVLLNDACTYSVFQMSDLDEEQANKIEFIPFNVNETWARKVLVENHADGVTYEPLDTFDGISKNSDRYVHLVIAGMTDMGMAIAVEAAHIAHFPNFSRDHSLKTIITFVDKDIEQKKILFKAKYRSLFKLYDETPAHLVAKGERRDFIDVEWEFLDGDIRDVDVQYQNVEYRIRENTLMTLAICYDRPEDVLSAVLSVSEGLYSKCIQVLAYQSESDEMMKMLSHSHKYYYDKVKPFGCLASCVDLSHKLMPLSRLVNYAYNNPDDVKMEHAMVDAEGNYHDYVSEFWMQQTMANRWSNVYNSDAIPTKLRGAGYLNMSDACDGITPECLDVLSEVEHRRWNMEKLLMGFRPLTAEEQQACLKDNSEKKRLKNELMAHLDICSLGRLREIDAGSVEYDANVTRIIPTMIKEYFKVHNTDLCR